MRKLVARLTVRLTRTVPSLEATTAERAVSRPLANVSSTARAPASRAPVPVRARVTVNVGRAPETTAPPRVDTLTRTATAGCAAGTGVGIGVVAGVVAGVGAELAA